MVSSDEPHQRRSSPPCDRELQLAHAESAETRVAINELLDELDADQAGLTFVFFSPEHRADVVGEVLGARTGTRGIAGTTGGELSSAGFTTGTMTGMSLHGSGVRGTVKVIPNLREVSLVELMQLPGQLAQRLDRTPRSLDPTQHLWLLFATGRSGAQSLITRFLMQEAPSKGVVGGSFCGQTPQTPPAIAVHNGNVHRDAALLALLEYDAPFELIYHSHLELTDRSMEVTGVSDQGRILESLDGRAAGEVFAETIEVPLEELTRQHLVNHQLGCRFRGRIHTFSPFEMQADGSMLMGKPVHLGDELRLMEPDNLADSTHERLAEACRNFENEHETSPRAALMFHCLGRYLEAEARGRLEELEGALTQLPISGFNSFGELYDGRHTNHSLTGLLLG